MSEATQEQQPSTEPVASTAAPEPQSLEQVFESYKVQVPSQETRPQPTPQPERQPQGPHIPDPALDPEGFRRYESANAQELQTFKQALQELHGEVAQSKAERFRQQEEADLKTAVSFLKETVDADELLLEGALAAKANRDKRLLGVWNDRQKNPQAWNAALKAFRNELAGKFTTKTDPQLTENVRAMKAAQSHMATAQPEPSAAEKAGSLQGAEFDRYWDRLKSG